MIPTQVSKIWLGAVAFLALWGILALMISQRREEVRRIENAHVATQEAHFRLGNALQLLSQVESANLSYLISPPAVPARIEGEKERYDASRQPFEKIKNAFGGEYKKVKKFYSKAEAAKLETRFKAFYNKWFALNDAVVKQRYNAGGRPSSRLISAIAEGQQERAQVLDQARNVLRQYYAQLDKRLDGLETQQEAQQATVKQFTDVRTAFGVVGIVVVALLLARQAQQLGNSNDTLRREIESRRRAERERQILSEHNEQILNSTTEGIVGLNVKGRITFVNPSAASALGWEVTELLGKSWHDIAQHSRGDNTRLDKDASPVMATLRDTNPRRISDDVFWKRTGRTFPVEYAVSPLWELSPNENEEKQLAGATLTFRDITERKRSEIALLRLASVVESSKDAILSHLLDGTIVSCNASAVKMYGYSPREIEGQPLSVLLPPSRADEALLLVEHIARGERIEPYQTTLVTKGGGPVDVAITFYPVLDARGNIMGASSNARPVRRDARGDLPTFETLRVQKSANGNGAPRPGIGAAR